MSVVDTSPLWDVSDRIEAGVIASIARVGDIVSAAREQARSRATLARRQACPYERMQAGLERRVQEYSLAIRSVAADTTFALDQVVLEQRAWWTRTQGDRHLEADTLLNRRWNHHRRRLLRIAEEGEGRLARHLRASALRTAGALVVQGDADAIDTLLQTIDDRGQALCAELASAHQVLVEHAEDGPILDLLRRAVDDFEGEVHVRLLSFSKRTLRRHHQTGFVQVMSARADTASHLEGIAEGVVRQLQARVSAFTPDIAAQVAELAEASERDRVQGLAVTVAVCLGAVILLPPLGGAGAAVAVCGAGAGLAVAFAKGRLPFANYRD